MTDQELYNKVKAHLLAQRTKAMYGNMCRYRTPDGLKCAIGCLIPDDKYNPSFEGRGIADRGDGQESSVFPIADAAGIVPSQFPLAGDLQWIHDHIDPVYWEEKLVRVARSFHITP